ncbi:hypothetical protein FIV41_25835 [Pseudomonas marginalis]|uniref:Phage tail tape measure protein n=1 Tax=Pseudomonas marginalis TaxID=298 RepID=A0A9X9BN29_PSEMA|nr:hypothetical protein [Pseudomonas marginalis]TWR52511.1 hypothetical protein FIV41_25835 [Pseudomonas marginalis]SEC54229.1 hypothetical protein SAMN04490193_3001 [Pseudomonas marginalis]
MNEQAIAELFAKIGFKVDGSGIKHAQQLLKGLERQAQAAGKAMQKALGGQGIGGKQVAQAHQAMNKAQFDAALQGAKLQKIHQQGAATGLKTQQQQLKVQQDQAKLAAIQAKAAQAATAAQAKQNINNALQHMNLTNRAARAQQQAQAHATRQALAQHRLNKALTNPAGAHRRTSSGHGGGLVGRGAGALHRFGGAGGLVGKVGAGNPLGAIEGLSSGLGRASMGLGAVAGSAALVVAAFAAVSAAAVAFSREAERASNVRNQRIGQFEAVGDRTPEGANRINNRFESFAQTEGFDTKSMGADYAKIVGGLAPKVGVDKAQDTTEGILRYAKAQHLSNENISKVSLGLRQALGKGQLYSEEWTGQISEHLGAHANSLGAEAWQRATGGNKTGDEALKAFNQDRKDKKISGDALIKFVTELGSVMDRRANDGGLLDKGRMTQDSWDNRIRNQYQSNMAKSYDNTDLKMSMVGNNGLYDSITKMMNELQPQFLATGRAAATIVDGLSSLIQKFTQMTAFFNNGGSYLDPKFMGELGGAFKELGVAFSTLWTTLFGNGGLTGGVDVLKITLEAIVGVITFVVDGLTAFVDVLTWIGRKVQDIQHYFGNINDEDYDKIVAQRASDDSDRQWQVDQRQANLWMAGKKKDDPDYAPNQLALPSTNGNILGSGLSAPTVNFDAAAASVQNKLATLSNPPITPFLQPQVNGQAANNTTNSNVQVTIGDTTINGATDTDALKAQMEEHNAKLVDTVKEALSKNSPAVAAGTMVRARGN